ncbi:MAG: DUF6478 family protein [Planktomarina sp.]
MSKTRDLFHSALGRISLARWTKQAQLVSAMKISQVRRLSAAAIMLRVQLDRFLRDAEDRLTIPRIGSNSFKKHRGSDWAWRADGWAWRSERIGIAGAQNGDWLAKDLQIFHDCSDSEICIRQLRNGSEHDLAPFSFRMDIFGFDGNFLSFVQELPESAITGLRKHHLVRMDTRIEVEQPIKIFARLNVQHGPNTEQVVREIQTEHVASTVEFDLAMANINENRIERAWVDLIFDDPAMTQLTIREMTFSRSPRAEL